MFVKLENLWQYLKNVAARIKTKIITISIKDAFDIGENMAILKELSLIHISEPTRL